MRAKFLAGTAAVFLTGCAVLAITAPASAQARWHGGGFWPGAVAAGVIGGAVAAATSPLWAPGYYDYYPHYRRRGVVPSAFPLLQSGNWNVSGL